MTRVLFVAILTAGFGCSSPNEIVTKDASASDGDVVGTTDMVAVLDTTPSDVQKTPDAGTTLDATPSDVQTTPDVIVVVDRVVSDISASDIFTDQPVDRNTIDVSADVVVGLDRAAVDTGCSGAAPVVTIVAPVANESIETCTTAGVAVNYVFRANVTNSAPLRQVIGQWRTPTNDLAPPMFPALTSAPFEWRRQVGGPTAAGAFPALAVFPSALRGNWQFVVSATDVCGRTTTTMQAFTLVFTMRRCPNP
jgi:hypothetical protein